MPWQVFDHTADLGLRVEAASREALFEEAGRALTALIVEEPDAVVRERERLDVALTAADPADLLFDWLHALLVAFEVRHLLLVRFATEIVGIDDLDEIVDPDDPDEHEGGLQLRASAWGERVDPARHRLVHEVKAITYHGLWLGRQGAGWAAEVIVDV
ncbi:MAG: archease [Trueperaceae bacterium]|nr:archease [Trueperaceae bacterium]